MVPAGSSPGAGDAVYGITVAAGMVGMDPQSLRLYERRGLLSPARTVGGTRLYSADDVERLQRIGELLAAGLNIAGIEMVLGLESANAQLQNENDRLADTSPPPLTTRRPRIPPRS
jgi:MerR family transcriptional regulator/heat shock protein HspR